MVRLLGDLACGPETGFEGIGAGAALSCIIPQLCLREPNSARLNLIRSDTQPGGSDASEDRWHS